QKAQVRDLLLHLDRMIDPGRIGARLDVESDRSCGDDQEDCKSSTENDALRWNQGDLLSFISASPSALARHSLIVARSTSGVNGFRRQRIAPNSSAMRRKSGEGEADAAKA